MINKSCNIANVCRINDLIVIGSHQICASGVFVFNCSLHADFGVNAEDFANILHYKGAFVDVFSSKQTPALFLGFHRVHIGILVKLESPVSAVRPRWTSLGTAFRWHAPVNAVFSTVIRLIGCCFLVPPLRWTLTSANELVCIFFAENGPLAFEIFVLFYRLKLGERVS